MFYRGVDRESFVRKKNYPDKNLIEKVIRAFSLVELLVESGCPFVWKGGTSLMLILGQQLHRLSIDVDIICPPGTDITKYLEKYEDYGFVSKEEEYREQRSTDTSVLTMATASNSRPRRQRPKIICQSVMKQSNSSEKEVKERRSWD